MLLAVFVDDLGSFTLGSRRGVGVRNFALNRGEVLTADLVSIRKRF